MNYFSKLILTWLFITPATLFSQVDSITITHHWEFFDGDSTIENIVDSFLTGIHVSKFVYDVNYNPVRRTNYIWGQQGLIDSTTETYTNGTWINFHQTNNQFYPNDSLHISTKYYYINNAGVFDTNGTRVTITFDSITNTKIVLQEEMNYNSPWSNARRDYYTFDSLNRVRYRLSEFGANLQPSIDQYNYYLSNDSIDYFLYHTYQSGVVSDTDSVTYLYNSNGFLIEKTVFNIWNLNHFRPDEMRRYTYDANNNMLSSCNHLWDNVNGWYIFPDSTWSTYNSNNQITETATSFDGGAGNHGWHFYDGQNRPDSALYITWPHGGDTHYWYYKMEYPILNSINKTEAVQNLKIYPNPSSAKIFLDIKDISKLKRIEITDATGKMLKSEQYGSVITSIDISNLRQGIYYLHAVYMDRKEEFIPFIKTNP